MFLAWLIGPSRRQRSLAAAFVGEIAALLQGMEKRPTLKSLDDQSEQADEANGETLRFDIPGLPKFTIYETNARNIACFNKRTARELAYFYTRLATLSERLRILSSQIDVVDRERCVRLVNLDVDSVLEAGDQVLRQLRPLISRQNPASITRT
jgi:hypothetical protein